MTREVTLTLYTPEDEWPMCYYDRSKRCGDPALHNHPGLSAGEDWKANPGWHAASFCDCPSCPVRCAIRTYLHRMDREKEKQ